MRREAGRGFARLLMVGREGKPPAPFNPLFTSGTIFGGQIPISHGRSDSQPETIESRECFRYNNKRRGVAEIVMRTRRGFLEKSIWVSLGGFLLASSLGRFASKAWAKAKQLLPKGFPKSRLLNMNPAEIDNRNLEVDPLNQFGTMGSTEIAIDSKTVQIKVTGKVGLPLSLSYAQVLKHPSQTETVLLICPGFFSNNGRWTGVNLKSLLQEAQIKAGAQYIEVVGDDQKRVRIALRELNEKKIFLAYRVNGETLPRKHGFPLRLVYEDAYGTDWVKYVKEVVVS